MPPMVAAWAIGGRTAQQAADEILQEAERLDAALARLRALRLQAKERIHVEFAAGNASTAEQLATEGIDALCESTAEAGSPGFLLYTHSADG